MSQSRTGITPVIAVIMLVMLTLVAAGGAALWFSGIIGDAQDKASGVLNTELVVKDLQCGGSTTRLFLKNQGDTDLDAGDMELFFYRGGDLVGARTVDITGHDFAQAGGGDEMVVIPPELFLPGYTYRVEIALGGTDYAKTITCQATEGAIIAAWTFEPEAMNATHAFDVTGNDHGRLLPGSTGDHTTTADMKQPGKVGQGVAFDGEDDMLLVNEEPRENVSGTFTVTAWIKSDAPLGDTERMEWIGNPGRYVLRNDERTGRCDIGAPGPMFHLRMNDSNWHGVGYCGDPAPAADTWHHVAGVFDTNSRGVELWVNGVRQYQDTSLTNLRIDTYPSWEPSQNMTMGAHISGGNVFDGTLDEVRLYDTALDPTVITKLYEASN